MLVQDAPPTIVKRRGGRPGKRTTIAPSSVVKAQPPAYFARLSRKASRPVEKIRYAALQRISEGVKYAAVAEEFGVHVASLFLWAQKFKEGGAQALREMKHPNIFLNGDGTPVRARAYRATELAERRPLLALADLIDGHRMPEVIEKYDLVACEFSEWTQKIKDVGFKVLDDTANYPAFRNRRLTLRADYDAEDLRTAIEGYEDQGAIRKMKAIGMVYDGRSPSEIKSELGVDFFELSIWVQRFNEQGLPGITLHRPKTALRLDFDAESVMEFAATNTDPAVLKRCNAIASLYRGDLTIEVAKRYNTTRASVHNWCLRFNQHGIDWLNGKSSQQGFVVAKLAEARRQALSRSGRVVPPKLQKPRPPASVDDDGLEKMRTRVRNMLGFGRKVSVQAVASWIALELGVSLEKPAVRELLRRAGFSLNGSFVA